MIYIQNGANQSNIFSLWVVCSGCMPKKKDMQETPKIRLLANKAKQFLGAVVMNNLSQLLVLQTFFGQSFGEIKIELQINQIRSGPNNSE